MTNHDHAAISILRSSDEPRKFVVPNAVVFQEALAQMAEGRQVTLPFEGRSMETMLKGGKDEVVLAPVSQPLKRYDVVLYRRGEQYVLHRIVAVKGDRLLLRGDACVDKEEIAAADAVALMKQIRHADGSVQPCEGARWRSLSRRAVGKNAFHRCAHNLFNQRIRRRLSRCHFILLAVLMWATLGALGVTLKNLGHGIRMDHCAMPPLSFCTGSHDIRGIKGWQVWLLGCAVGIVTESVQYLIPYRGFDINDLIANFFGVSVGWCLMLWLHGRPRAARR